MYDHTIRVVDTIDTYRDLLSGTLDAHLAVASNRLNEIVKVLTSVSIILMTWATISGIYGMNFTNMPELHWRYGYPYALGLMAVTGRRRVAVLPPPQVAVDGPRFPGTMRP